jgi:hypothetical protein
MEKYVRKKPSRSWRELIPTLAGQNAEYEEKMGVISQLYNANQSAAVQQQEAYQAELAQVKQAEAAKLFEKKPLLRDQRKFAEWYSEAGTLMMEKYGFTAEEVNEATDHRFYLMMDDLRRLHTALNKANGKQGKPGGPRQANRPTGPRILTGSAKNGVPQSGGQKQRQVYGERLKRTGNINDAIQKLSTFDL